MQSPSAVILEPKKIDTVSIVSPSICNEVMGLLFDHAKAFDCVDHNKLWKIFKEMAMPDYLNCFLRSLYAGQEATVRTGRGTTDIPNWERSTTRLYNVTVLV